MLRLPTASDPLTLREQDDLFRRLDHAIRPGSTLLASEVENIRRMAATLLHYRGWIEPCIDETLPDRVTLRGIDYLREDKP